MGIPPYKLEQLYFKEDFIGKVQQKGGEHKHIVLGQRELSQLLEDTTGAHLEVGAAIISYEKGILSNLEKLSNLHHLQLYYQGEEEQGFTNELLTQLLTSSLPLTHVILLNTAATTDTLHLQRGILQPEQSYKQSRTNKKLKKHLRKLLISSAKLKEIPKVVLKCTSLCGLYIMSDALQVLPTKIGQLKCLQEFHLSGLPQVSLLTSNEEYEHDKGLCLLVDNETNNNCFPAFNLYYNFPLRYADALSLVPLKELPLSFRNLTHLRKVTLYSKGIEALPTYFFKNKRRCEQLHLSLPKLKQFPSNWLEKMPLDAMVLYNFPKLEKVEWPTKFSRRIKIGLRKTNLEEIIPALAQTEEKSKLGLYLYLEDIAQLSPESWSEMKRFSTIQAVGYKKIIKDGKGNISNLLTEWLEAKKRVPNLHLSSGMNLNVLKAIHDVYLAPGGGTLSKTTVAKPAITLDKQTNKDILYNKKTPKFEAVSRYPENRNHQREIIHLPGIGIIPRSDKHFLIANYYNQYYGIVDKTILEEPIYVDTSCIPCFYKQYHYPTNITASPHTHPDWLSNPLIPFFVDLYSLTSNYTGSKEYARKSIENYQLYANPLITERVRIPLSDFDTTEWQLVKAILPKLKGLHTVDVLATTNNALKDFSTLPHILTLNWYSHTLESPTNKLVGLESLQELNWNINPKEGKGNFKNWQELNWLLQFPNLRQFTFLSEYTLQIPQQHFLYSPSIQYTNPIQQKAEYYTWREKKVQELEQQKQQWLLQIQKEFYNEKLETQTHLLAFHPTNILLVDDTEEAVNVLKTTKSIKATAPLDTLLKYLQPSYASSIAIAKAQAEELAALTYLPQLKAVILEDTPSRETNKTAYHLSQISNLNYLQLPVGLLSTEELITVARATPLKWLYLVGAEEQQIEHIASSLAEERVFIIKIKQPYQGNIYPQLHFYLPANK